MNATVTATSLGTKPTQWQIDPQHSAAHFSVRHLMISNVRGEFTKVSGNAVLDPTDPTKSTVEVTIDAASIDTREPQRDEHLRSADFLDVEKFPEISFSGNRVIIIGEVDYQVLGNLTIRGVARPVTLEVRYLGQWQTPWWEDGVDKGPKTRAGFVARTTINRHDFGVSWNDKLDKGGIVVSDTIDITIDAEAILVSL